MEHVPLERLAKAAQEVLNYAYAPYSRFRVGVALEVDSGEVFTGCNVENASYGLTICAERAAVASAVSRGHTRFRRLVVATEEDGAVSPCGACRQVLAEFGAGMKVYSVGKKERKSWLLEELIPTAFKMTVVDD